MSGGVLLGVDAGGTKTDACVVGPDGAVLAAVRAPGGNHEVFGWSGAAAALEGALEQVLGAAGVVMDDVSASAWGLAGLDCPADAAAYRSIINDLGLRGPAIVMNDAFLALEVGPEPLTGVAVVSGTGAIAVGRAPDDATQRTLGVGAGRGDWGSGGDVVRAAVEAVAQQHMGLGPATALTERALAAAGVATAGHYCEQVWRHGRAVLRPPDVWAAAAAGDVVAAGIADRVADSLGAAAAVVARRLGLDRCDVVLAGRVLDPGHPVLHERLLAALAHQLPEARVRRLGVAPVAGAVLAAARLEGRDGDQLVAMTSYLSRLGPATPAAG